MGVNEQAASDLMRLGSDLMAKSIKTEADAKKAERIMKLEDVLVNKLIPMKKNKMITSEQFMKSAIMAGHSQKLDRHEVIDAVLGLQKVDQMLESRAGIKLRDTMDIDLRKAKLQGERLDNLKKKAELFGGGGQSRKEQVALALSEQKLRAGARAEKEAQKKPLQRAAGKALEKNVLDTTTSAISMLNSLHSLSLKSKGKTQAEKVEEFSDVLGDTFGTEEETIESSTFEFNKAKSLPHLADLMTAELIKLPEFINFSPPEIKAALLKIFNKPETNDVESVLNKLLEGSPRQQDDLPNRTVAPTEKLVPRTNP